MLNLSQFEESQYLSTLDRLYRENSKSTDPFTRSAAYTYHAIACYHRWVAGDCDDETFQEMMEILCKAYKEDHKKAVSS